MQQFDVGVGPGLWKFVRLCAYESLGGPWQRWLVAGDWRFSLSFGDTSGWSGGLIFEGFRTVTARPPFLADGGRAGLWVSVLRAAVSGPKLGLAVIAPSETLAESIPLHPSGRSQGVARQTVNGFRRPVPPAGRGWLKPGPLTMNAAQR